MISTKPFGHEARTSLLSAETDGTNAYTADSYPPYRTTSPSKWDYDDYPEEVGSGYTSGGGIGTDAFGPLAPGGYAQREGLVAGTGSPGVTKRRAQVRSWKWWPSSKWQWYFVGIVVVQAVCGLALESYIFGAFQANISDTEHLSDFTGGYTVTVYLSLYIFGYIYQLLLTYDAMRMKNTIQLIGLCVYNFGLMVEAAMETDQIYDALQNLNSIGGSVDPNFWNHILGVIIAVPIIMAIGTAAMSFVTWKLYKEFSWSIYKDISADLRLKRRFLAYQIYIALLKFDFFFFLAFTMEFLVAVGDNPDVEKWLTVAAIPVTIIILLLAALWVQKEILIGMIVTIIIYFGGMAYFVFKLVRMWAGPPDRIAQYLPARRSLTTFAVITILLLAVTIVYAIMCTVNFKKGLKEHIDSGRHVRAAHAATGSGGVRLSEMYAGEGAAGEVGRVPGAARITID